MADMNDLKCWINRDLARCGNLGKHIELVNRTGGSDEGDGLTIRVYTERNSYQIRAVEPHLMNPEGYMGCVVSSRVVRAGENQPRGRDLHDGYFAEETWFSILADIVAYEMVVVHQNAIGTEALTPTVPVGQPKLTVSYTPPNDSDPLEMPMEPGQAIELKPGMKIGDMQARAARKPKVGDIVVYYQPVKDHEGKPIKLQNGHRDHPAIITCVWSDTCVNLKVLFDCGDVKDETSVNLLDTPLETNNPHRFWMPAS